MTDQPSAATNGVQLPLAGDRQRWLCLDPGNTRTGWVVVESDTSLVGHLQFHAGGHDLNTDIRRGLYQCREFHRASVLLVETPRPRGQPTAAEEMETLIEIGRFLQMWRGPWSYVFRMDVKLSLLGTVKGTDANVNQAIKDRFGGISRAIGGVKCKTCKGKTWIGRNHDPCSDCGSSGWSLPPGPLHGVASHQWPALGVACFWSDSSREFVHDVAGKQPTRKGKKSEAERER